MIPDWCEVRAANGAYQLELYCTRCCNHHILRTVQLGGHHGISFAVFLPMLDAFVTLHKACAAPLSTEQMREAARNTGGGS